MPIRPRSGCSVPHAAPTPIRRTPSSSWESLALVVEAGSPARWPRECKTCGTAADVVLWPSEPGLAAPRARGGRGARAWRSRAPRPLCGARRRLRAPGSRGPARRVDRDGRPGAADWRPLDLDGHRSPAAPGAALRSRPRPCRPPRWRRCAAPAALWRPSRRVLGLHVRVRIGHLTVVLSLEAGGVRHHQRERRRRHHPDGGRAAPRARPLLRAERAAPPDSPTRRRDPGRALLPVPVSARLSAVARSLASRRAFTAGHSVSRME